MDSTVNPAVFLLLLLCVGVGAAVIGWAHEHGHDGTVKQVANTVQTSLQNGQRLKEVQDRVDPNRVRPNIYGLYSAEYPGEVSEGEP
jgi:hypothetical protein